MEQKAENVANKVKIEKLEEICSGLTQEKHDLRAKAYKFNDLHDMFDSLKEDHQKVVNELFEAQEA